MNVLTLVPQLKAPSCRFRVLQYVDPLAQLGIHLKVVELSWSQRERWRQLDAAADFEAVLVHRKLLNCIDYHKIRRKARKLIYDFDDALMFRDSNAPRMSSRSRGKKFRRLVAGADLIIAGNEYLSGWSRRFNRQTVVIPTAVDLSNYPDEPPPRVEGVVGWMGTESNFVYLKLALPALQSLARKRDDFRLTVVSDGNPVLPGVPLRTKEWSLREEADDLRGFAVGIMPLRSDPWAQGKCALKILQYFAALLPVVCSPVGMNLEVVEEGINGYFAASPEEWEGKLDELLSSPEKRFEMGRAGRKLVEEKYCLEVMVPKMVEALKAAVE